MTGGLTNLLYRVDFPADARLDPLLVRRFGAEAFLNRSVEDQLFAALSAAKIAPPYHGRFVNGRIEGFLVDWIGASLGATTINQRLPSPCYSPLPTPNPLP